MKEGARTSFQQDTCLKDTWVALSMNSEFFRTFRAGLAYTRGLDRGDSWTYVRGAASEPLMICVDELCPFLAKCPRRPCLVTR
jgi:hypothetical protein